MSQTLADTDTDTDTAAQGPITVWLERWRSGDGEVLERMIPLVYDELRRLARRQLRRESPAHTLSSAALVHEVYLRLLQQRQLAASDRDGFFAAAAQTMRRILTDHARTRLRAKRGAGERAVPLDQVPEPAFLDDREAEEVLSIDLALQRLGRWDARAVQVIECRVFAGLTLEETAQALGLSSKSVQRTWNAGIAWLRKDIGPLTLVR
jgi:RNA polymerase sigma factor (TIGR02999 family)